MIYLTYQGFLPSLNGKNMKLAQVDFKSIQSDAMPSFEFADEKVGDIVSALIKYIIPIAGALFLIFFIVGGFQFMISAGDPKKAEAAKGRLTTALIGLLIIVFAYLIVQFIATFLNIPDIRRIFG